MGNAEYMGESERETKIALRFKTSPFNFAKSCI